MNNETEKRWVVTKSKLALLEETYRAVQNAKTLSHADELTLESLSRRMNRLREEISQFNLRQQAAIVN